MALLYLAEETDSIKGVLHPDEMLISGADISFAGAAIGCDQSHDVSWFSSSILALSHIVSRIVLSDRLVVVSERDGLSEPNSLFLWTLLEQYCDVVLIESTHPGISDILAKSLTEPEKVFGETLFNDVRNIVTEYSPWSSGAMSSALLAEYATSISLNLSYAPNPCLSKPIGAHALSGTASPVEIARYLTDLRNEVAQEEHLHEEWNIYDLNVPAIFASVIKESNNPEDIIRVAAEMNSEAKEFRSWCRDLDLRKKRSVKTYRDQMNSAKDTLRKMGTALKSDQTERIQMSYGIFGIALPSPTLQKTINHLNVDIAFLRPRKFLLNLLRSSIQLQKLAPELARVFNVDVEFAKNAADRLVKLGSK